MKRFLTLMAMVSAVVAFSSCNKDNVNDAGDGEIPGGEGLPTIEWPGNEDFAVMNIDANLDADLVVKAPAGIKAFVVDVDSDVLEAALALMKVTTSTLDLINDDTVIGVLALASGGTLPTGDKLLNQTEVNFSIASLVRMISGLPAAEDGSEHVFNVTVTDNNDKSASAKCIFKVVKEGAAAQAE